MSEENEVPVRTWVNGTSNKEIIVRGKTCQVGLFNEAKYQGVNFNPLICAICFDSKGETMKLNKEGEKAADGQDGIVVGSEWVEHEFFQYCVDPESTKEKCMCRCNRNFVNLEADCPYYMQHVAQVDPNDVTPIVQNKS